MTPVIAGEERWNQAERGETPLQSQDRHYAELLQELRVVQTGIQILMALLLVLTLAAAMFLITNVVIGFGWASFVTAGLVVWFVLIWFVVPLWARVRDATNSGR